MPDTSASTKGTKKSRHRTESNTIQISQELKISAKDHEKLLQHIIKRLNFGNEFRKQLVDRFRDIDVQYNAHLKLSKADKKRDSENKRGKALKPTDMNLSLTRTQIEDGATFLLTLFAPNSGMFEAVTSVEKQDAAQAVVERMNYDGEQKSYFTEHNLFFINALKYNLAGMLIEWDSELGNVFENSEGGTFQLKNDEVLWEGNTATNIDVYNVIWDPTVLPTELYNKGEFFATIEMINEFRIDMMIENNELFGAERFIDSSATQQTFYEVKPDIRTSNTGHSTAESTMDWANYFGSGAHATLGDTRAFEIVNIYMRLKPADFELSNEKGYRIWRFTMVNGQYIGNAVALNNAHSRLPAVFTIPMMDQLDLQAKSYGEALMPLQIFASYLLNVKQRAERKALYGLNVYDPNIIPLDGKDTDEASNIPINPATLPSGKKIEDAFKHFTDVPDTQRLMGDIAGIIDLMQRILPTDQLQQVAGLERATQFQAAAVVQASNRVNHKIGKVIDDQALKHMRFMLIYNLYQFNKEPIEITDPQTKEKKTINPSELRAAKIEHDIGAGLKGIDRLQITQGLGDLLNRMLQIPDAFQRGDIWGFMDYFASLLGDKTDLKRFEYKHPLDALTPQQKDQALALIQQASQQANPEGATGP